MSHFRDFICLFLVALAAHTCMAAKETIEEAKSLVDDIDGIIETTSTEAKEYKAQLKSNFQQFTTYATSHNKALLKDHNDIISLINRHIKLLEVTTALVGIDITECTDMVFPVIAIMNALVGDGVRCLREQVEDATEAYESLQVEIDLPTEILVGLQQAAKICITRFDESSQSASEAAEAEACVEQAHGAVKSWELEFRSTVDISGTKSLLEVYKTGVAKCASIGRVNLDKFSQPGDRMGDDIVACAMEHVPIIGK